MNFKEMIENAVGGSNPQAVEQAATDHISAMAPDDVAQHLQTAADNANQNGEQGIAQEIESMIARKQVDPEGLKAAAIAYIKNNPQVLTHFAPGFAQGILNRVI